MDLMPMSPTTKHSADKDWPFAITLTVLVILTLVLALFDPSCRRQDESPRTGSSRATSAQ
jgi:hypothetical protein